MLTLLIVDFVQKGQSQQNNATEDSIAGITYNAGGYVKNVHLNCGPGGMHSRSIMFCTTAPFFISISNQGGILGANGSRFKFDEKAVKHGKLLLTNVNIGEAENIILNGVDIAEVYSSSSFGDAKTKWKP